MTATFRYDKHKLKLTAAGCPADIGCWSYAVVAGRATAELENAIEHAVLCRRVVWW